MPLVDFKEKCWKRFFIILLVSLFCKFLMQSNITLTSTYISHLQTPVRVSEYSLCSQPQIISLEQLCFLVQWCLLKEYKHLVCWVWYDKVLRRKYLCNILWWESAQLFGPPRSRIQINHLQQIWHCCMISSRPVKPGYCMSFWIFSRRLPDTRLFTWLL